MDNVFEQFVNSQNEGTTETEPTNETNSSTEGTSELGDEFDLTAEDLDLDDESNEADAESDDPEGETNIISNPTNEAFASMRTQNKEFKNKLDAVEAIIKASGLNDIDDFIAKSKEAQIKQAAKEKGIPESLERDLEDLKHFKEDMLQDKQIQAEKQKEANLVSNLESFIDKNGLSQNAVSKLSDDLENDGLTTTYLMSLPKAALNRVLTSYIGGNTQKNLERKVAIKNEVPLNQSSKVDLQTANKQIDELAKMFAGKL